MKPVLFYLAQVIIISGVLYGYYHFFLRNKKFHTYNRYYLLSAILISIVIPFLNIPVYFTRQQTEPSTLLHTLTVISAGGFEESTGVGKHSYSLLNKFTLNNITALLYFTAAVFLFIRFIAALLKIARLKRIYVVEEIDSIDFINTSEDGTPFSFFRNLFWNKKISLDSEDGKQIFRHELFHIQQKHSLDIIFTELTAIVYCMNPFFFLIKKEIKTIHEFLADSFAVNKNQEWNYAELLLMQVLGSPNNRLSNHFFHNQIKRRIAMITSSQKTSYQYMRKLLVLPVAFIITALFAFKYKAKESPHIANVHLEKAITVVIDAGHGDSEPGVIASDGTKESDITLQLAQKVKELNKNDRIHIVLTRETKDIVDLRRRTEIANGLNPDLFISLHSSASENKPPDNSGFEVYISKNNKDYFAENTILGRILLNYFMNIYKTTNKIQQSNVGIWVLDNSNCPSALVECGYMTNKKDLEFIKKPQNQDKIAQSILNSIEQFATQKESPDFNDKKKQAADTTKPVVLLSKDVNGKVSATINGITVNDLVMNSRKQVIGFILDNKSIVVIPEEDLTSIENKYGSLWNEYYDSFNDNSSGKTMTTSSNQATIKKLGTVGTTHTSSEKVKTSSSNSVGTTFTSVEVEPSFPGGELGWRTYLQKNLNANVPLDSSAPSGSYTVWVEFLVAQDGTVSDIKTLTNPGYGTEAEVIKMIKNGPKWNPAIQNGRKVTAYKKQPVTFIVQEEKSGG